MTNTNSRYIDHKKRSKKTKKNIKAADNEPIKLVLDKSSQIIATFIIVIDFTRLYIVMSQSL